MFYPNTIILLFVFYPTLNKCLYKQNLQLLSNFFLLQVFHSKSFKCDKQQSQSSNNIYKQPTKTVPINTADHNIHPQTNISKHTYLFNTLTTIPCNTHLWQHLHTPHHIIPSPTQFSHLSSAAPSNPSQHPPSHAQSPLLVIPVDVSCQSSPPTTTKTPPVDHCYSDHYRSTSTPPAQASADCDKPWQPSRKRQTSEDHNKPRP